jgi:hypothetical protein
MEREEEREGGGGEATTRTRQHGRHTHARGLSRFCSGSILAQRPLSRTASHAHQSADHDRTRRPTRLRSVAHGAARSIHTEADTSEERKRGGGEGVCERYARKKGRERSEGGHTTTQVRAVCQQRGKAIRSTDRQTGRQHVRAPCKQSPLRRERTRSAGAPLLSWPLRC